LLILGGSAQTHVDQGVTTPIWVQNAGFIWVPFIVLSTLAAWFGMDNIASVRAGFADQVAIFKHKHQWLMSWLYTGTFGSFHRPRCRFPDAGSIPSSRRPTPSSWPSSARFLAALVRPIGGWLADRIGGASITVWCFVVMAVAPLGAVGFLPGASGEGNVQGFVLMFLILFVAAGIGNGTTIRMIPIIFRTLCERQVINRNDQACARTGAARGEYRGRRSGWFQFGGGGRSAASSFRSRAVLPSN
jgi:NNP family nitrate/nitrite transporter-like MFS transporter